MVIRVACPSCQMAYDIEETFRGKQVVCSRCNQRFQIGGGAPAVIEPAAEPTPGKAVQAPTPKKKTPLFAWLILGGTFLFVAAVVITVMVYLFLTLGGEDEKAKQAKKNTGPVPVRPPNQADSLGPLANDPKIEQQASHTNPALAAEVDGFYHFPTMIPAPMEDASGQKVPKGTESLSSEVLRKVKRGTVFIRAMHQDGHGGTGSGFFCFNKGLVVTNAHVVGMLNPADPEPSTLEVILFSNERDELKLKGRVVRIDRKMDLALIQVPNSDKLPEPLSLVSSETLEETQPVFVIGFPFGESLGKDVTINRTSISSLRRDKGVLREVQVNGGMNPGNSGGPVVDALGRVIGISVRIRVDADETGGLKNTGLNFAVPSDYAYHLGRGNLTDLSLFPPYQETQGLQIPLRALLVNPDRGCKVFAECWTGPQGPERAGGHTPPKPEKGDSERKVQELRIQGTRITGSVPLPPPAANQVYWMQLVLQDARGNKHWTSAHWFKVDGKHTLQRVAWHPEPTQATSWRTDWCFNFDGTVHRGGSGANLNVQLRNLWNESSQGARKQTNLEVGFRLSNQTPPQSFLVRLLAGRQPEGGAPPATEDDANGLSSLSKFYHQAFHNTFRKALGGLEPVMPDKALQPMESWGRQQDFPLDCIMVLSDAPQMRFEYTYLGMSQVQGRPQAIIAVEGQRLRSQDNKTRATLIGMATVDAATRKVTYVYAALEAETEAQVNNSEGGHTSVAITGNYEFRLKRQPVAGTE
jgi:S1-C subfamily serine protease